MLLSVISISSWVPSLPLTSAQLLVGGGALLFVAGVLLGLGRKQRVSLQRSVLTDELMIYLSRIADAVERRAERPSAQEIAEMIERRVAEKRSAETASSAGAKSRTVALSMFGREYPEKS